MAGSVRAAGGDASERARGPAAPPARAPEPAGPPRSVRLLGGFELRVAGAVVTVPAALQRAIAYLCLRGACGRSRLAGTLWPDATELRALANLRTGIWRLNRVAPGVVVARHDTLALTDGVTVDVARLQHDARALLQGSAPSSTGATERYVEGDLLPDWPDEWLTVDRERLRQLRLHVLEALAGRLTADGLYGMALETALAALQADPLRESAHRAVIRVHLAEGNLAEAVHAYRRCRALLAREIGVAPSPETRALADALPRALLATG